MGRREGSRSSYGIRVWGGENHLEMLKQKWPLCSKPSPNSRSPRNTRHALNEVGDVMTDLDAANDPNTSPDELGKLANHSDPEVVAAAVSNPNTPQWAKNRAAGRSSEAPPSGSSSATTRVKRGSTTSPEVKRLATRSAISYLIAAVTFLMGATIGSSWLESIRVSRCLSEGECDSAAGMIVLIIGVLGTVGCLIAASLKNSE